MVRSHSVTILRELGARVRQKRHALGLSQETLAENVGLHRNYIGGIEQGRRNVSVLNLMKLSRGLGVDPCELVGGLHQLDG